MTQPERIGRYQILRGLREGFWPGYVVREPGATRTLALWPIPPEVEIDRDAFLAETRRMIALSHPNVLAYLEVGEARGAFFLVSEMPPQEHLAERLSRGADLGTRLQLVCSICEGLAYTHSQRIVHGELSPANVWVSPDDSVRIDCRAALLHQIKLWLPAEPTVPSLATASYYSPEQCRGEPGDERADVFTAGSVFYAALTGSKPFAGQTLAQMLYQIVFEDPPAPRSLNPEISEPLQAWLQRALAKDPDRRFPDAGAMQDALSLLTRSGVSPDAGAATAAIDTVTIEPSRPPEPTPPGHSALYRLTWTEADHEREFVFGPGEFRLGRAGECHVTIRDFGITFYHARIVADSASATLFDTESKSGTYLNDQPVPSGGLRVQDGDRLQLGRTKLRFETVTPRDWSVGDVVLGLYELTELLGEGGMGQVYRARHRAWGLDLAVKSPRREIVARAGGVEAFVQEAETWVKLGLHPHVVTCFYVRVIAGVPRVFAEYIEGGTLADWIQSGRLYEGGPETVLTRILDVALQSAWGLEYAHDRGLVHQDVKPANVLMTPAGVAKVTDFGIAQMRTDDGATQTMQAAGPGNSVWVSGSGLMTPAYCSPEQARRQPLTPRTDVWSWGLAVLEMFQGERTWAHGAAAAEALRGYLEAGPTRPDCPPMPPGVVALLTRCFAAAPGERPGRGREVVAELWDSHPLIGARPDLRQPPAEEAVAGAAVNNRALSLFDLGQVAEAESLWQKALTIEPLQPEATFNLGLLLWRSGRLEPRALERQLSDVETAHPEAGWLAGLIAAEQGDHAGAADRLRRFAHVPEAKASLESVESRLARSRKLILTTRNPASIVAAGLFSSAEHGPLVASADRSGGVRAFGLETGSEIASWQTAAGQLAAAAFAPDAAELLTADTAATLALWRPLTGECLATLKAPAPARAVAIDALGRRAVVAFEDDSVGLWDLDRSKPPRALARLNGTAEVTCLSLVGSVLAAGTADGRVIVWDLDQPQRLAELKGSASPVTSLSVSRPRGHVLAAGGDDGDVRLIGNDPAAEQLVLRHGASVTAVALTGDLMRLLVSGGADGSVRLWQPRSGRCLAELEPLEAAITTLDVTTDAGVIVAGGSDGSLRAWRWDGDNPFAAPWLASRIHSGRVLRSVERNTFTIDRDLLAYQRLLGLTFMDRLYQLGPEQHWVDAGAGEALAVRDYLAADAPPSKARVTAVSIVRPQSASLTEIERRFAPPGFRYLAGKPIEERAVADLGLADLITDVYGPLQYARQIDAVVEMYGRLLKTGGFLIAVLPAITFLKKDGEDVELTDWLRSLRGFTSHRIPDPGAHLREVILERNRDPIVVPPVRLIRVAEGPPPLREFAL